MQKLKFLLPFAALILFWTVAAAAADKFPPTSRTMTAVALQDIERLALAAKPTLETLARDNNRPVKLYLHWSAGHYGDLYDAYHINIDADGALYVSTPNLGEVKPHTYMRNSGAIGITLACGFNANPKNLGAEPPTDLQLQRMADVIAVLAKALQIPIDRAHVMTHGEAGDNEDGIFPDYADNGRPYGMYGPFHGAERWDLAILKDGHRWRSGGTILRLEAALSRMKLQRAEWDDRPASQLSDFPAPY